MPHKKEPRYPPTLDEPIIEHPKFRVGDTTLSVAFTGMRRSPQYAGFISHYELIIKRKGGEYWYRMAPMWDPTGKARLYTEAVIDTFAKFLRRVKYVNHHTCPVCRGLKLNPDVIEKLKEHVDYGEYHRIA